MSTVSREMRDTEKKVCAEPVLQDCVRNSVQIFGKKFSQTTMVMEKEQKAHKKWSLFSFILTLATKTLVCKGPIMFKLAKNDGLNPYVLKSCC